MQLRSMSTSMMDRGEARLTGAVVGCSGLCLEYAIKVYHQIEDDMVMLGLGDAEQFFKYPQTGGLE